MLRMLTTSLFLLVSAALPRAAFAQYAGSSLAGTRELGIFGSVRLLSPEFSADQGREGYGGAVTFATHLTGILALQAGLSGNYSRQGYSYYRPPLTTFTPAISLVMQRSTEAKTQPYAVLGGGYEFVRFRKPRCDCEQSLSYGIGNVGLGIRKMTGGRRALRFEVSGQIGQGTSFTALAGMTWFLGTRDAFAKQRGMKNPEKVKPEPPVIVRKQPALNPPSAKPPSAAGAAVATTAPVNPAPANTVTRTKAPSPLPTGVGTVLFQFDGTQVDFSKPTWRDDAEPLLDALVVDLTSDAGQNVRLSIEAHTDNIGANAANIVLGLDRARVVRDYLVTQGVAPDRIRISSEGEEAPVAPNTTAMGRQQNRRIVIKRDN